MSQRISSLAILAVAGALGCTPVEEVVGPTREIPRTGPGNERVVEISSRAGVHQRFLLVQPPDARAVVVLFAGDTGYLEMDEGGVIRRLSGNFLLRTRDQFIRRGLAVVTIDTPSDRTTYDGFRTSRAHALDVKGVIAYLRDSTGLPVWLVGTSRGTVSVAGVAGHLGEAGPDGIVLTSTVTVFGRRSSVYNADLGNIRGPVLLVHHRDDGCSVTPYRGMSWLKSALEAAGPVELVTIDGGIDVGGNPCQAWSPHGFLGQEDEVVKKIADWILAQKS